jgi:hypothetical protein
MEVEDDADLLGDLGEQVLGRRLTGDHRRDAPQRRLLLRQAFDLLPRVGVRDRHADQFGERLEALLDGGRQRLVARRDDDRAPERPLHDDRARDHGARAPASARLGERQAL